MNQFIKAIQNLDYDAVDKLLHLPKWKNWAQPDGKNALHYLGSIKTGDAKKAAISVKIAALLLKNGLHVNSIHNIPDKNCDFPATTVWYAYTRGRNEKLYTYLLKNGGSAENCMFAIAWNDDVKAAALFQSYGATIKSDHFLAAFFWKRFKVADWFLKQGADINFIGPEGYSALMLAVKRKSPPEMIRDLLSKGADPYLENDEGVSPVTLAEKMKLRSILRLLTQGAVAGGRMQMENGEFRMESDTALKFDC